VTAANAHRRRLDDQIKAGTRRELEAIGSRLEEAPALLPGDPAGAGKLLNQLVDEVQEVLEGLRDLARGIFPPLLAERGLAPALQAHARKVGLAVPLEVAPEVAGRRFDPEVEAAVYFGSVESLAHAARSDPEAGVCIRLVADDRWLELAAPRPDHDAFNEVADRVEAVGGSVTTGPGARFIARVPLLSPESGGRFYPSVVSIRVVIAEDSYLVREGIRQAIEAAPDLEVVGVAEDLGQLQAGVEKLEPDVVVTDIRMPPTGTDEGIRLAADLRDRSPATGVVVVSQYVEPEAVSCGGAALLTSIKSWPTT
jgi:CheY-like chemotaxis protein